MNKIIKLKLLAIVLSFIFITAFFVPVYAQSIPVSVDTIQYSGPVGWDYRGNISINSAPTIVYPGRVNFQYGTGYVGGNPRYSISYSANSSSCLSKQTKSTSSGTAWGPSYYYTVNTNTGCVYTLSVNMSAWQATPAYVSKSLVYVETQSTSTKFTTGQYVTLANSSSKIFVLPYMSSIVSGTESTTNVGVTARSFIISGNTWWEVSWEDGVTGFVKESDLIQYGQIVTQTPTIVPPTLSIVPTAVTVAATATTSCPEKYSLNSDKSKCILSVIEPKTINAIATTTCPSGYNLSRSKRDSSEFQCTRNGGWYVVSATKNYLCPTGYSLNKIQRGNYSNKNIQSTCSKDNLNNVDTSTSTRIMYSCPSGYVLDSTGESCSKIVSLNNSQKQTASIWDSVIGWFTGWFN